jgi:hypothetical protein
MRRLGAQASTIPAGNIAALQGVTAAISAQAEAMIRLAAVPFGNLGGAAAQFGSSGGALGGSPVTVNIYGAPGQDVNTLANIVIQKLNTATGARR